MASKRNKVTFAAPQGGGTVTTPSPEPASPHWWRIAGAVILGMVAIAAAVFGLMQVQDWSF